MRVQGHDDQAFDAETPFHLGLEVDGIQECVDLNDFSEIPMPPATATGKSTVIVTDTNKLLLPAGSAERATYMDTLGDLASETNGVVVDVTTSSECVS